MQGARVMRREHASTCDPTKNEQQRGRAKKRQVKGAIAQLGEHLLCKQGVRGSIPRSSTMLDKSITNVVFLPNVNTEVILWNR